MPEPTPTAAQATAAALAAANAEGAAPEPAPAPEPAAAPAPAAAAPTTEEVDLSTLPQPVQDLIKSVREEAATHRVKHVPFRDAFDGLTEGEVELILGMVGTLKTDGMAGAMQMRDLSFDMLGDKFDEDAPWDAEELAEELGDLAEEQGEALTMEQVQEAIDAAKAEAAEEAALDAIEAQIISDAEALGYSSETPESTTLIEYLFQIAADEFGGDVQAAHNKLAAAGLAPAGSPPPAAGEPEAPRFANTAGAGGAGVPTQTVDPPVEDKRTARERTIELFAQAAAADNAPQM